MPVHLSGAEDVSSLNGSCHQERRPGQEERQKGLKFAIEIHSKICFNGQ
jgi:hypothetical protein